MPHIEELGIDLHGKVSSQLVIKSGKNKGRRKVEVSGTWIHTGGFCYESRQESKSQHKGWIEAVLKLGHRVGSWDYEGVRNFYVFESDNSCGTQHEWMYLGDHNEWWVCKKCDERKR
jgi:hypothetical protein